jgi:hypothetical protein
MAIAQPRPKKYTKFTEGTGTHGNELGIIPFLYFLSSFFYSRNPDFNRSTRLHITRQAGGINLQSIQGGSAITPYLFQQPVR